MTNKKEILNTISIALRPYIKGVYYIDDKQFDQFCVYVVVDGRTDSFYEKVLDLEYVLKKKYDVPISMHVWDAQGRTVEQCKPPGTTLWVVR